MDFNTVLDWSILHDIAFVTQYEKYITALKQNFWLLCIMWGKCSYAPINVLLQNILLKQSLK